MAAVVESSIPYCRAEHQSTVLPQDDDNIEICKMNKRPKNKRSNDVKHFFFAKDR